MTNEKSKQVLMALANGHTCNTTDDYSVSIHNGSWKKYEHFSLYVYPSEHFPFYHSGHLCHMLAIAATFNVHFNVESRNGVVVGCFS